MTFKEHVFQHNLNPASQLGLWCANSILGRRAATPHNFSLKSRMRLKTYTFTKSDLLFPKIVLSFRSDVKFSFYIFWLKTENVKTNLLKNHIWLKGWNRNDSNLQLVYVYSFLGHNLNKHPWKDLGLSKLFWVNNFSGSIYKNISSIKDNDFLSHILNI